MKNLLKKWIAVLSSIVLLFLTGCGYRIPGSSSVLNSIDVEIKNQSQGTLQVYGSIEQNESSQGCDFPGSSTKQSKISSRGQYHFNVSLTCNAKLTGYSFYVGLDSTYEVVEITISDEQTYSKLVPGIEFKVFDQNYQNPATVQIISSSSDSSNYQYLWHRSPQDSTFVAWITTVSVRDEKIYKLKISLPLKNDFVYVGMPDDLGIVFSRHQDGHYYTNFYKYAGLNVNPTLKESSKNELICDDIGCNLSSIQ